MGGKLIIVTFLFSVSTFLFLTFIMLFTVSLETKGSFVKVDSGYSGFRNLETRLRYKVIELERYEEQMDTLQRMKSPILVWTKYILKVLLSNKTKISIGNIIIILITFLVIIASIGLFTQGILVSIILIVMGFLMFLNILNALALLNRKSSRKDVLLFLSIFHTNYMRSESIENAVKKTLDSIDKTSWLRRVLEEYLANYTRLGRSRSECIDILKRDLGGFKMINTYLEIVKKAETTSPSYKNATSSIPENFEIEYNLQEEFSKSMILLVSMYTVFSIVILYMTVKLPLKPEVMEVIKTNYKTKLLSALPYFILVIAGIITFMLSSNKGD